MIYLIRVCSIFALVWTLSSFGFASFILFGLGGEKGYIESDQLYAAASVCMVSALVALSLIVFFSFGLLKKDGVTHKLPSTLFFFTGAAFLVGSIYSFLSVPGNQQDDFFGNFLHSAAFEFAVLGAAALLATLRSRS